MTDEHWQRVKQIVEETLQLPEGEWEQALAKECKSDELLLTECRSQLAATIQARTLFEEPGESVVTLPVPGDPDHPIASSEPHLRVVDRYLLKGRVGVGGQGAVYEVWDKELHRRLAMKVVFGKEDARKPSDTPPADPETLSRFLEEAQITGQLDHPGVVPIHELGLDPRNQVFFTMRLVRGDDFHKVIQKVHRKQDGWNLTRALGVVQRSCEAIAYAHSKKVIHRDLKPSNLMVGKYGEVYVMDWGLARVIGQEDRHDLRVKEAAPQTSSLRTERRRSREGGIDSPLETMDGRVLGTPSYMPPEQATGQVEMMGPESDVYSMGAVLYQLLTGRVPYAPAEGLISAYTILAAVIQGPPESVASLSPTAPPELIAICEKAMARKMEDRYPDTDALAADLRSFLEGRVVAAYESGAWAELLKWIGRNRGWAATGGIAALLVVAALAWALVEQQRAEASFLRALAAKKVEDAFDIARFDSEESLRLALEAFENEPDPDSLGAVVAALPRQRRLQLLDNEGRAFAVAVSPDQARFAAVGAQATRIWDMDGNFTIVPIPGGFIHDVGGDPARPLLAVAQDAEEKHTISVIDFEGALVAQWEDTIRPDRDEGQPAAVLDGLSPTRSLQLFPRSERVLVTRSDGTVRVYGFDGVPRQELSVAGLLSPHGDVSPDEEWIAAVGQNGQIRVWKQVGGQYEHWGESVSEVGPLQEVRFSPREGDPTLVVGTGFWATLERPVQRHGAGIIRIPEAPGPLEMVRFIEVSRPCLNTVRISPDGTRILTCTDREIALHGIDDREDPWSRTLVSDPHDRYYAAQFLPGTDAVLAQRLDGQVTVLNENGETRYRLRSLETSMSPGAATADGKHWIQGARKGTLLVWDLEPAITPSIQQRGYGSRQIRLTPDRSQLLSVDRSGLHIFDARSGELSRSIPVPDYDYLDLAIHPDGTRVILVGAVGYAIELDLESGRSRRLDEFRSRGTLARVEFSPDGTLFAMSRMALPLIQRDGQQYQLSRGVAVWDGTFSRDGRFLLLAGYVHPRGIYEIPLERFHPVEFDESWSPRWSEGVPDDEPISPYQEGRHVRVVAYSPDHEERRILTGSRDGAAQLWDRFDLDGDPVLDLQTDGEGKAHDSEVRAVAFSPDGSLIGTGSADGTARIWTIEGELLLTIRHDANVVDIAFVDAGLVWTLQEDCRLTAWIIDPEKAIEAAETFLGR